MNMIHIYSIYDDCLADIPYPSGFLYSQPTLPSWSQQWEDAQPLPAAAVDLFTPQNKGQESKPPAIDRFGSWKKHVKIEDCASNLRR